MKGNDSSTSNVASDDAPKHGDRPAPPRLLSEGYTHVFNARPASLLDPPDNPPSAAVPPSSKARTHYAFNSNNTQFSSGLDWLLDAVKDSERRPSPTLRGTPLTEGSLRVWNQSKRAPRHSGEASQTRSDQTGSSSEATTHSSKQDSSAG